MQRSDIDKGVDGSGHDALTIRSAGINKDATRAMAIACVTMGKACAAERSAQTDVDEMCRHGAMASDDTVMKWEPMMASMSS